VSPILRFARGQALSVGIAAAVLALALPSGGYGITARALTAIVAWWLVILVLAHRLAPPALPRLARLAAGALGGLALLTGLSIAWASSAERAFDELDRTLLYLGIFLAALLVSGRGRLRAWTHGLAGGIAAVALVALGSRCLPGLVPAGSLPALLPGAQTRLSYPLEYWNGLGIFIAVGVPLLLAAAVEDGSRWGRGLALAPLPAMAAALYLTSSRGATAVLVVGILASIALTPRRVAATAATFIAAVGGVGAILVLQSRPELVDGPVRSAAARADGPTAALLIVVICLLAGLLQAAIAQGRLLSLRVPPRPARIGVAIACVLLVVAAAAADPVRRLDSFKQPPSEFLHAQPDFVRTHLLSGGGSGRWQFWSAALSEFRGDPIVGRGAGAYAEWWTQHASITYSVRNAHSLYLETLGDLGLVGAALLAAALGTGLAAAVAQIRARGDRATRAGLVAAFVTFLVGAGIDWIWQLTVVGGVGMVLLALLVGPAALPEAQARVGARRRTTLVRAAAIAVVGLAVIAAESLPWLVQSEVRASQRAAGRGDLTEARTAALGARKLQPWASSPHLQLALVSERAGALGEAGTSIREAIAHDPGDWKLRVVAARIALARGASAEAHRDLGAARRLNPRSPLLAPPRRGR
jgi:hypothetical protein